MDDQIASKAWQSINEMLIQNKCWICQNVFQKGKKKKVFMISQIIQSFQEINSNPDDDRVKILTAFMNEAPHVTLCWQSFQYLKGDELKVANALQKADVQVWVSGLACARNHLCQVIYNSLFSTDDREAQMASIQALKGSFTRSTFCPPGCDCGWQFISSSRPELLVPSSSSTSTTTTTTSEISTLAPPLPAPAPAPPIRIAPSSSNFSQPSIPSHSEIVEITENTAEQKMEESEVSEMREGEEPVRNRIENK